MKVVELVVNGKAVEATVALASSNGRSLVLTFDDAVPVGGGLVIGMLPVMRADDGTWTEILTGGVVEVRPCAEN